MNHLEALNIGQAASQLFGDVDPNPEFMGGYVDWLEMSYRGNPAYTIARDISLVLDKIKKVQGYFDRDAQPSKAFFRGGLLAVRAVDLTDSNWVLGNMNGTNVTIPAPEGVLQLDVLDQMRLVAHSIGEVGHEGYAAAPMLHESLDAWEVHVTRSAVLTHPYREGFGFMMHSARALSLELCGVHNSTYAFEETTTQALEPDIVSRIKHEHGVAD